MSWTWIYILNLIGLTMKDSCDVLVNQGQTKTLKVDFTKARTLFFKLYDSNEEPVTGLKVFTCLAVL